MEYYTVTAMKLLEWNVKVLDYKQFFIVHINTASCTNGDIRLGDSAVLRGRIEVCINGTWGTICDHHWTQEEASVVCSHLGYSPYGIKDRTYVKYFIKLSLCLGAMATKNIYLNYEWPIGLFELRCSGNEINIWDCSYNTSNGGQYCHQHNDASVFCMREFIEINP